MPPPQLPQQIVAMMASREHRLHHYLWHNVRENWLRYGDATRAELAAAGWAPPRPALDAQGNPNFDNGSGEDFLYMHREMIAAVNRRLAEVGDPAYPRVEGWTAPPPADDPDWPVPPLYPIPGPGAEDLAAVKSEAFYSENLMPTVAILTEEERLRGWTLGRFGALVEYYAHNAMHMRWSAGLPEFRPENDDNAPDGVDPRWDDPAYDWLGDTYSSHVSPTFWKIHGWVDRMIDLWADANGVAGDIQWTGKWTGPFPHHAPPDSLFEAVELVRAEAGSPVTDDHGGHQHGHGQQLARAARAVRDSGIECHFYTPPGPPPL